MKDCPALKETGNRIRCCPQARLVEWAIAVVKSERKLDNLGNYEPNELLLDRTECLWIWLNMIAQGHPGNWLMNGRTQEAHSQYIPKIYLQQWWLNKGSSFFFLFKCQAVVVNKRAYLLWRILCSPCYYMLKFIYQISRFHYHLRIPSRDKFSTIANDKYRKISQHLIGYEIQTGYLKGTGSGKLFTTVDTTVCLRKTDLEQQCQKPYWWWW